MIDKWDNRGVLLALLPKCLQNGSNPPTIGDSYDDSFPVFLGNKISATSKYRLILGPGHRYREGAFYPEGSFKLLTSSENIVINRTKPFTIICFFMPIPGSFNPVASLRDTVYVGSSIRMEWQGEFNTFVTRYLRLNGSENRTLWFTVPPQNENDTMCLAMRKPPNSVELDGMINGYFPTSEDIYFESGPVTTNDFEYILNWFNIAAVPVPKHFGMILYDRYLSNKELTHIYNLGPDLGGLEGYDKGDGTMLLKKKRTVHPNLVFPADNTNVQNNTSTISNVITTKSGYVSGQKQDYLFN